MTTHASLYWIDGPWLGRLAILSRPRGGDWLADEVRSWSREGINLVVSALVRTEVKEWELEEESKYCLANGIEYSSLPIQDRGVPGDEQALADLVRRMELELTKGNNVGIHCRAGIGRSAIIAASVLAAGGIDEDVAFERIAKARGGPVPDTAEQREWVARFVRNVLTRN